MREITILLLGVGGNVSQGILKAIRHYDFAKDDIEVHVIGACISPDSIGLYMCDEACLCPYASDPKFIEWVISTCRDKKVDIILTGVEENIIVLQDNIQRLNSETDAIFIASDIEKLRIGQDKYQTCRWLKENDGNCPGFCSLQDKEEVKRLIESVGFPLIAKPCHGKGSNGVVFVKDDAALERLETDQEYVLEEYIGNPKQEFTVGCYCDRNGTLQDIIIMHRKLEHGSSAVVEVIEDADIYREAKRICEAFRPTGPLNIQMRKRDNGQPVCFDLYVRFSGTTPMRAHFGFQDVIAMIKEYCLGESIQECFRIEKGVAYRYTNEFYLSGNAAERLAAGEEAIDMHPYHFYEGRTRE